MNVPLPFIFAMGGTEAASDSCSQTQTEDSDVLDGMATIKREPKTPVWPLLESPGETEHCRQTQRLLAA